MFLRVKIANELTLYREGDRAGLSTSFVYCFACVGASILGVNAEHGETTTGVYGVSVRL